MWKTNMSVTGWLKKDISSGGALVPGLSIRANISSDEHWRGSRACTAERYACHKFVSTDVTFCKFMDFEYRKSAQLVCSVVGENI